MTTRTIRTAFFVSLAINCLLVGLLVGNRYFGEANALARGPLQQLLAFVPPGVRPALRQEVFERRFRILQAVRKTAAARSHVRELASADPVDHAALEQSLSDLRNSTLQVQGIVHEAFIVAVESTPVQERQAWPRRPFAGILRQDGRVSAIPDSKN